MVLVVKNPPGSIGDTEMQETQIWSLGDEDPLPLSRKWQPLEYSYLENFMDRGTWWATVMGHKDSDMTEHTAYA